MSLLINKFREQTSKSKDYKMKVEREPDISYSTGFLSFDFINGRIVHAKANNQAYTYYSVGIVDGSMNMLIGRAGCGKTTFAVQASGNIIRNFPTSCLFHDDIEGGLTYERLKILTGMSDEMIRDKYVSRNTGITAENFYERVKMISDIKLNDRESYEYDTGYYDGNGNRIFKLEPTIYLLDSLALLMPEKYTDEDEMSGQMSATAAAKANAGIFKRITPMLKTSNIILLVINHINDNVDINPMAKKKASVGYLKQSERLPGGNTPQYLSNNMLRFDDHSKLKESETFGIDGTLVDITLVKSRTNKAGKSATLVFNQDTGYDSDLSLLILLKKAGRINGAGAFLYIDDCKEKKFSQKQFKNKLREDPEFMDIFMKASMDELSKIPSQIELECNVYQNEISNDILNRMNGMAAA